jgi:hypothetical protein
MLLAMSKKFAARQETTRTTVTRGREERDQRSLEMIA